MRTRLEPRVKESEATSAALVCRFSSPHLVLMPCLWVIAPLVTGLSTAPLSLIAVAKSPCHFPSPRATKRIAPSLLKPPSGSGITTLLKWRILEESETSSLQTRALRSSLKSRPGQRAFSSSRCRFRCQTTRGQTSGARLLRKPWLDHHGHSDHHTSRHGPTL